MIGKTKHYGLELFGQDELFSTAGINRNTSKIDRLLHDEYITRTESDNLIRATIVPISREEIDRVLGELYGTT